MSLDREPSSMPSPGRPQTLQDIIIVTSLCFGWFILASINAVASGFPIHPFTDSSFLGLIAFELVLGALALGYLSMRGYHLGALIPCPTPMGCLVGLVLLAAANLAAWPLELLLTVQDDAIQPIDAMAAQTTVSFAPLVAMSIVNGLYEEVFLVGYLQRSLESSGPFFAIGVSLLIRMLYHLYQGPAGALYILGFGLVLSLYFSTQRKLWPIAFAHIVADMAAFS